MITTQLMLESLHSWTIVHKDTLQQYLQHYPYANYQAVDTSNSFRHKIIDIVNHIITLIAPHHHYSLAHRHHSSPLIISPAQFNSLCKIKTILDDLKIIFLTVGTIKRINIDLIFDNLEETMRLATLSEQKKVEPRVSHSPRNRSFDQVGVRNRPKSTFMRRYEDELTKRRTQKERTALLKNELYRQMNSQLSKNNKQRSYNEARRERRIESQRRERIESQRRPYMSKQIPLKYDYGSHQKKQYSNRLQNQWQKERSSRNRYQKRLFKYLQEDLSEKRRRRQQEQQIRQYRYETPKRNKLYTLPSTQEHSLAKRQDFIEYQLPQYEIDQMKLDELKKQLDQRLKMSKIQYTDPQENEENEDVWQQFEKDSTQNENSIQNNLEDSLELMKQEEALNKTGQFNPIPITIAQEVDQYSFSQD